jgi:hypothetical protein
LLFKALEPRSLYAHQSSTQAYKANKQGTKNNAPIKRKDLKERTKGIGSILWITKEHKMCLEGKGLISCTWFELELTLDRFRASDGPDRKRYYDRADRERLTNNLHIYERTRL